MPPTSSVCPKLSRSGNDSINSWLGWDGRFSGHCGMEENKKSGGGDVRAEALSWDGEWDKAKNKFSALSPLSPTVGCFAPHSHPSPPEKKAASRKKSRLRRKKTATMAKNGASCVSRVAYPYLWILATTDPPRLISLASAFSKLRFRLRLRLHGSCPQYAISDGSFWR